MNGHSCWLITSLLNPIEFIVDNLPSKTRECNAVGAPFLQCYESQSSHLGPSTIQNCHPPIVWSLFQRKESEKERKTNVVLDRLWTFPSKSSSTWDYFPVIPAFRSFFFIPQAPKHCALSPCRPRTGAAVDVGHQAAGGQPATFEERNWSGVGFEHSELENHHV